MKYHSHEVPVNNMQHKRVRAQHHAPVSTPPMDFGGKPFVVDISKATSSNDTFRTALWSGSHLQLTVMCINPGEDIGLEVHRHLDQFLCIVDGCGLVQMSSRDDNQWLANLVFEGSAIFVPAGTWHNLTNTGDRPLKLYSIYAPPNHQFGTIHQTKEIAEASESH